MKTLIIYASLKGAKIEKLSDIIGKEIGAEIVPYYKAKTEKIIESDIIGFGFNVYRNGINSDLINFIKNLPYQKKRVFIFWLPRSLFSFFLKRKIKKFKKLLNKKGFNNIEEFECGNCGFFNSDKNNLREKDIKEAKDFAKKVIYGE